MSVRKRFRQIGFLTLVMLLLAGCGGAVAEPTTVAPTSVPPTATPPPIPATDTPIPPTSAPTEPPATHTAAAPVSKLTISLASEVPEWAAGKMMLSVLNGAYQMKNGATLKTGSLVYVFENDLTFPKGLVINVEAGGVSLGGTSYPEGTFLYVSDSGELTVHE
jgi:hypothetical protein